MSGENTDDGVLASAEFSSGFIGYSWIMTNVVLAITMVGLLVNIFWIPFGWIIHKKQLDNASLTLTKNGIQIRKGWIFKAQQNIPLDKLTDISIHEGPILNMCNIVKIAIETAGATPFHLIGLKISVATQFRDVVMMQRDALANKHVSHANISTSDAGATSSQSNEVLVEIRDILHQINANLSKQE
ncbi:MAG: PH domain-containing protein [Poseidonia sp.]